MLEMVSDLLFDQVGKSDDYAKEAVFEEIFSSLWHYVTDNRTKVGDYVNVVFTEDICHKYIYDDIVIPLEMINVDIVFALARYVPEAKTAVFFVKRIDRI